MGYTFRMTNEDRQRLVKFLKVSEYFISLYFNNNTEFTEQDLGYLKDLRRALQDTKEYIVISQSRDDNRYND